MDPSGGGSSNVENVPPQVVRSVAREVQRLVASPPAGIKLLLGDNDITDIVALIDGPVDTPYAGGVFRVRLSVGRDFPAAPPRAYFITKIFHPNVSATGEVCVSTLAREWRPELGLSHALLAIKCLLIAPNPDSALNADAGFLLRHHYEQYCARAKLLTEIHATPAASTTHTAPSNQEKSMTNQNTPNEDEPSVKRERRPPVSPARTSAHTTARDKRRILKRL